MHARTHACMHAHTHARMHARTHVRTHACMHARAYARTHAIKHAHTHMSRRSGIWRCSGRLSACWCAAVPRMRMRSCNSAVCSGSTRPRGSAESSGSGVKCLVEALSGRAGVRRICVLRCRRQACAGTPSLPSLPSACLRICHSPLPHCICVYSLLRKCLLQCMPRAMRTTVCTCMHAHPCKGGK